MNQGITRTVDETNVRANLGHETRSEARGEVYIDYYPPKTFGEVQIGYSRLTTSTRPTTKM